jgi:CubicO group peptidase (beta-lactamase class C family)
MNKRTKIVLAIIGIILITLVSCKTKIKRIRFAMKMFSGVEMVERFRQMENYFPTREILPSNSPSILIERKSITLPESYTYNGKVGKTSTLLEDTDATGLLIIRNDTIIFEKYYRGNTKDSHTIAWSVTKSFVSALMGIAIQEGHIKSIDQKVSDYLPELNGSAYQDVTIKNLLQMSSGVSWNEDYSDRNSDINRFGRTLALGRSFEKFVKTLEKDKEQGTYNRYNSSDTQVLGMIISKATGKTLSKYLEEKIWKTLGMQSKAWWMVDNQGHEFAAAGLSASLRDYARFGRLYLNHGKVNNQQIISEDWIKQSLTMDAPHLLPGKNEFSSNQSGYGFQWWIYEGDEGEYAAMGIYNQLIYINPTHNIIIVKSSANNNYGTTNDESSFREEEIEAMIKEIVKSIK